MEDIILKRIANITSAQALDEISDAYPDAEVLSFRRIKEVDSPSEFFVARLKAAVIADQDDDIVLDNEDVVIEDQVHEDKEEDTMNKIVELLTDVLAELTDKNDSDVAKEGIDEMQLEMEDMPLPEEEGPDELEERYQNIPNKVEPAQPIGFVSTYVVSRDANVSKKMARLELIREVSSFGHKVESIKKIDNKYYATIRLSADEDNDPEKKYFGPYVNPEAKFPRYRRDNPWLMDSYGEDQGNEIKKKKIIDDLVNNMENPNRELAEQSLPLKPDMEQWLLYREKTMRDAGVPIDKMIDVLDEEYKLLKGLPGYNQRKEWYLQRSEENPDNEGISDKKIAPQNMDNPMGDRDSEERMLLQNLRNLQMNMPEGKDDLLVDENIDWNDEASIDWSRISPEAPAMPSPAVPEGTAKNKKKPKRSPVSRLSAQEMMKSLYEQAFGDEYEMATKKYSERENTLRGQIGSAESALGKANESKDLESMRKAQADLNNLQIDLGRIQEEKEQYVEVLARNKAFNQDAFKRAYSEILAVPPDLQAAWFRKSEFYENPASVYKRDPSTSPGTGPRTKPLNERQREIQRGAREPFGLALQRLEEWDRNRPKDPTVEQQAPPSVEQQALPVVEQQTAPSLEELELQDMREQFGIPKGQKWQPTPEQLQEYEALVQQAGMTR